MERNLKVIGRTAIKNAATGEDKTAQKRTLSSAALRDACQ
jgi:hypothetical protein